MAADSVGQIGLDLVVNQNQFKQQMASIQGMAKKAGLALAAAFSVKKIVDFGAQCIELGSDLAEVQNVVDVTFPRMSKQIDKFAQEAAASFGLSETMAKRFTGTFGAMAKAFGFNEKAAYEMSTTLTGLAGDVASFYNISQDDAYTKLKSVFTGETEALKDLGIVMTQSALDSYALANGFGKTTKAMSEAEKVALRYKFVQDQLSLAAGDFSRTSDSWANQVRLLQLQFQSLQASIGQGLIAALTPVIRVINAVIGRLISLANAVKSVFSLLGGGGSQTDGAKAQAAAMGDVAESADQASEAISGTGSAAKKAAKEASGATTGIDELNILKAPSDSGAGGSGGAGGIQADQFDLGELDSSTTLVDESLQKIADAIDSLKSSFSGGFWDAFGDTKVFDSIKESLGGIKNSLREIFTDPEVVQAAGEFANTVAYSFGQVSGAMASIGATIADNLLGGISLFLEQNSGRIREFLIRMFDIGSDIASIIGNFSEAVAEIFSVFRSDSAKQITADIIGIFSDAFMGITELLGKIGRDILNVIAKPIIDNKDDIKDAIQSLLNAIQPIVSSIKDLLAQMFDGLNSAYDTYAKPVFDALAQTLSDVVAWCLENTGAIQAITLVVSAFFAAWEVVKLGEFVINAGGVLNALQSMVAPLVTVTTGLLANAKAFAVNTAAKIADKAETAAIVALYAKDFVVNLAQGTAALVKQASQFAINTAAKAADAVAQAAMTAATVAWNAVCTVATTLTTALGAAIAFLTSPIGLVIAAITALIAAGILLYQNWDTVKAYASQIWSSIKEIVRDAIDKVEEFISATIDTIKSIWEKNWTSIKTFLSSTWDAMKKLVKAAFDLVYQTIRDILGSIKTIWTAAWDQIQAFTDKLWNAIKQKAVQIFQSIRDKLSEIWASIKQKIESIWNQISSFFSNTWQGIHSTVSSLADSIRDKIASVMEMVKSGIETALDRIKEKWEGIWTGLKETTISIFDKLWDGMKGVINSILSGIETMANGVVKGINKMIDALNGLSFDVPEWVPGIGGESFGLDIPNLSQVKLPRLAQGGFVRANTPQLAMIGDNRHYGEIVAPEDKLQEMVNRAAALASGNNMNDQYLAVMVDLLKKIIELIEAMDLTVNIDIREIKKKLTELDKRTGYTLRTT